MPLETRFLYGGDQAWDGSQWETSDDRVRGGASQSYLTVSGGNPGQARFHGNLDTSVLGGAGFASQHSCGELSLDLREYQGIIISIAGPEKADGKKYVVTLKDELLPRRKDGRERSSISWEADFVAKKPGDVKLPWKAFKATYRGKDKPDAEPLDLGDIKRLGLMMRSFFGEQEGDFNLNIFAIAAYNENSSESAHDVHEEDEGHDDLKKNSPIPSEKKSWWKGLFCGLL